LAQEKVKQLLRFTFLLLVQPDLAASQGIALFCEVVRRLLPAGFGIGIMAYPFYLYLPSVPCLFPAPLRTKKFPCWLRLNAPGLPRGTALRQHLAGRTVILAAALLAAPQRPQPGNRFHRIAMTVCVLNLFYLVIKKHSKIQPRTPQKFWVLGNNYLTTYIRRSN
jgi:hypothetical protein